MASNVSRLSWPVFRNPVETAKTHCTCSGFAGKSQETPEHLCDGESVNQADIRQAISKITHEPHDDAHLAEQAVSLAAELLADSTDRQSRVEKRQSWQLARMMEDEQGKAFTLAMADQVFRPPSPERSAAQFRNLVDGYGVPEYLSFPARVAMRAGATASRLLPEVVMPAITGAMLRQSASVILPAEDNKLKPLLDRRRKVGMRMNLNQLGEAILGEA